MLKHSNTTNFDGDEYEIIFVKAYRHYRTGKWIVAAHYGLEAFPLKVKRKKDKK